MPRPRRAEVRPKELQGLKYFRLVGPLLDRLQSAAAARDHAGNRRLYFDQYAGLLLLTFFNPILTSPRALQQASGLAKVQKLLGCERAALGSPSEAGRVFDPALLRAVIGDLAAQAAPLLHGREAEALRGLTVVDETVLAALPKMAWALWRTEERALKMRLQFDVLKGVPSDATVTCANGPEIEEPPATLQAGRLYVSDRGYAEYQLFQDVIDARSSFVGRIRRNAVWAVVAERPVGAAARAAGVRSDRPIRPGCVRSGPVLRQPPRVIEVDAGTTDRQRRPEAPLLAAGRLDLGPEFVCSAALAPNSSVVIGPPKGRACLAKLAWTKWCFFGFLVASVLWYPQ